MDQTKELEQNISSPKIGTPIDGPQERCPKEFCTAQSLYRHIIDTAPAGFFMADLQGRFIDVNEAYLAMTGYSRSSFLTLGINDIDADESPEETEAMIRQLLDHRTATFQARHRRKEGSFFYAEVSASVMQEGDKRVIVAFCKDITEQKEERQRIYKLLKEKELLIKEVHHRVKNDLYFVQSMLNIQASMEEDSVEQKNLLNDAQSRLSVLMQVYQELYEGPSIHAVDSSQLLKRIASKLGGEYFGYSPRIITQAEPFEISAKMGITLGTLINEMIVNSIKHGTSAQQAHPAIRVSLSKNEEDSLCVTVEDQGPGFSQEVLEGMQEGFGMTVIRALAQQYDGTITLENCPGAKITACLKMPRI